MSVIRPAITPRKPESSTATTGPLSRRPWPTHQPGNGPLFDLRRDRLVLHLHKLGPKPISEYLKELVGNDDGLQADALFLLEKYSALDPQIVAALGGSDFPPAIFSVGST